MKMCTFIFPNSTAEQIGNIRQREQFCLELHDVAGDGKRADGNHV